MANEKMVELLKRGPRVLAKWRQKNPDVVLDLVDASLAEADLRGANLKRADLIGADLSQVRMTLADLARADLTRCVLTETALQGTDLSQANMAGAEMNGTQLQQAKLIKANLSQTSINDSSFARSRLRGANFERATIVNVDFTDADLRNVRFDGATISDVDMSECDLTGAALSGVHIKRARLTAANLTGCRLDGASFTECVFGWSVWGNLNLSQVTGLDTCRHTAPSTIGIDTLARSGSKIPESFLTESGVPPHLVSLVTGEESALAHAPVCFICHTENEQAFAKTLQSVLRKNGLRCWLEEKPNDASKWKRSMLHARPHLWDALIVCATKQYLTGPWIEDEYNVALKKEQEAEKARVKNAPPAIVAATLDAYLHSGSWDHALRKPLAARSMGDFSAWRRSREKFMEMAETIAEKLKPPAPKPTKSKKK